jgi:hypothetical protein
MYHDHGLYCLSVSGHDIGDICPYHIYRESHLVCS